jgi:hypothetical protein
MPPPARRRHPLQCTTRNTPIAAWSTGASCRLHRTQRTALAPPSSSKVSEFVPYVVASPYGPLLSVYSQVTSRPRAAPLRGCPLRHWGCGWPRTGCGAPRNRSPRADLVRATLFPLERSVNNPECIGTRVVRLPRNGQSAFEGRTWICSMASHRRSADSSEPVSKVEIHLPRPIGWPASPEVG